MDSPSQVDNLSQTENSSIGKSRAADSASAVQDIADGVVATHNAEYERYLDLHRVFDGPARKALIRKRTPWRHLIANIAVADVDTVDFRLLPTLSFLYLMCSLDKSNAGNAKVWSTWWAMGAAILTVSALRLPRRRGHVLYAI